ncbi:MAG: dihydrodipicolinate synthase family protein [Bacteroidota bacterium]
MAEPWSGVFPAITTAFTPDGQLDHATIRHHVRSLLDAGVHGLVALGSLGENGVLSYEEKLEVLNCVATEAGGRIPLLAGVAETTTELACSFARDAETQGANGLMLLPPMQYHSDRRETLHHMRAVGESSPIPIMIYNNPVTYRVDITPEMFAELAVEKKFVALKESTGDPRRITDIQNLVGDRYRIFVGVDDVALESFLLGAVGWVAGLVCAFPGETVALYELFRQGRLEEARELYSWFMPLLHLDTSTKFVQYIKLAEQIVGLGTEHVRPPRLPLEGEERTRIEHIIQTALERRLELRP